MTFSKTLYGQLLQENKGRLPDVLGDYSEAQLREVVVTLMDGWEVLSIIQEVAPTGLSMNGCHMESWRTRSEEIHPTENIPLSLIATADLSPSLDRAVVGYGLEWGDAKGARSVFEAPREVLEEEIRRLHNHLVYLRTVLACQLGLVDRLSKGHALSEEGLYKWSEPKNEGPSVSRSPKP